MNNFNSKLIENVPLSLCKNLKLEKLCNRQFGEYKTIKTFTFTAKNKEKVNLNDVISKTNLITSKSGIKNINLIGQWSKYKFIAGTQIISEANNNFKYDSKLLNIEPIPLCKKIDYYLLIISNNSETIEFTFDYIEFDNDIIFTNSNVFEPDTYYVMKSNDYLYVTVNDLYVNMDSIIYSHNSPCIIYIYVDNILSRDDVITAVITKSHTKKTYELDKYKGNIPDEYTDLNEKGIPYTLLILSTQLKREEKGKELTDMSISFHGDNNHNSEQFIYIIKHEINDINDSKLFFKKCCTLPGSNEHTYNYLKIKNIVIHRINYLRFMSDMVGKAY